MKKLIKAEILWTRKCPLKCSYCSMVDPFIERAPLELMVKGLSNLKDLGCEFIAIYGASPLYDFKGLPEYIEAATDLGILSTVIIDGSGKDDMEKVFELYDYGLRSLTVSYDFSPYDKSSRAKTNSGMFILNQFSTLDDIRDVEFVSTITKDDYYGDIENLPNIL